MQYTKQFFAIAVLMSSLSIMHSTLNAECGAGCACGIDRAEYKALEERIHNLESLLVSDGEEDESDGEQGERAIVDKIENFVAELKRLRKDVFSKINHVRKEVKSHTGDIKKIKEDFDALCVVLGSPKVLESIGDGAETVYAFIVSINARINALEEQLKANNQS